MRTLAHLALVPIAAAVLCPPPPGGGPDDRSSACRYPDFAGPRVPETGRWSLTWDDEIDDTMPYDPKRCTLELDIRNGVVDGRFFGPVLGGERDAGFSGTFIEHDRHPLLSMRQDEDGYTCMYAARLTPEGGFRGTWFDTNGAAGDFLLWPVPERQVQFGN